jgi:hypothetical protein
VAPKLFQGSIKMSRTLFDDDEENIVFDLDNEELIEYDDEDEMDYGNEDDFYRDDR